ncbi:MAG: hypothetical protein NWE98_11800 [Candidatus Bathyarchaeota archaeon]|nr:hypothetical protein [Candidatus Bathyarchaeota archaeon]
MVDMKTLWRIALISVLILMISTPLFIADAAVQPASSEKVYFGITFGGTTVEQAKELIDKVKSYTNLFVIASWTIDGGPNSSALTEVCDYAVAANMYFIVYFNFIYQNYTSSIGGRYNATTWDDYGMEPWHRPWLNSAKERYGDKFLGAYLYDEPGGKQIDCGYWNRYNMTFSGAPITYFRNVTTYDGATRAYVSSIARSGSMQVLTNTSYRYNITNTVPVFTSDYALYWFDYKVGYSAIFVEVGNKLDTKGKMTQIALCRGAATAYKKDWGAIITLIDDNPPTAESGPTMLKDMTMAYEAGAKYVIVFNYEADGQSTLSDEHFNAMKEFWNNIHSSASSHGKFWGQVALVLPADYGWGFRNEKDRIWGFWDADNKSSQIWENTNKLVEKYGLNLDIVYEDSQVSIEGLYRQTYPWNSTLNLSGPWLSTQAYVLGPVVGSVGAAACFSTYWITKRKKPKKTKMQVEQTQQTSLPTETMVLPQPTIGHPDSKTQETPAIKLDFIFNSFADIADPLFDLLMNLNGSADWKAAEISLERCKLAKVLGAESLTHNLSFQALATYIKKQQFISTKQECESLIKTLYQNALALGSQGPPEEAQKFEALNAAVRFYFLLNDVLLRQALKDKEVERGRLELASGLDCFSEERTTNLFAEFTSTLRNKTIDFLLVGDSRALLRKQFCRLLRYQQSIRKGH